MGRRRSKTGGRERINEMYRNRPIKPSATGLEPRPVGHCSQVARTATLPIALPGQACKYCQYLLNVYQFWQFTVITVPGG